MGGRLGGQGDDGGTSLKCIILSDIWSHNQTCRDPFWGVNVCIHYSLWVCDVTWRDQSVTFFSKNFRSIILDNLASNMTTHILQQLNLTNFEPHIFFDKCKILKLLSIWWEGVSPLDQYWLNQRFLNVDKCIFWIQMYTKSPKSWFSGVSLFPFSGFCHDLIIYLELK